MALKAAVLVVLGVAGCRPTLVAAQPTRNANTGEHRVFDAEPGTYDPRIPSPQSVIGHATGDGAVRYDPMVRYLRALADASPRVMLTPYAESHEGRTLYYLTITSEKNHARLATIKADNAKLADPRRLSDPGEADRIIETLPAVAWMAYAIHGDELSSTDAALQVAYHLTAGTEADVARLRDELVIHIDPLMNPDGRERYLGQLQHLTGRVPNPDYQAMQHVGLWPGGRGNHYLFDLNRDWLMQVHPETRGRAARILEWNPHLAVDSHEMGSRDTYLFDPPRKPHNVQLSAPHMAWRRRFSADQAKAFDRYGWSYYTREWYEEWYPGYANAWTSLAGAIGLLYEQAGVNAASVTQATGQALTYREAVHHQYVSSLANLETLRANRRELLRDYLTDKQWAVSAPADGPLAYLLPPTSDRARFNRFLDLLGRHGIEVEMATRAFDAAGVVDVQGDRTESQSFPEGTLVIRVAQPKRRLLLANLEFDPHMSDTFLAEERKELERRRGTRIYDVTAWNLSMAYGLEAYSADRMTEAELGPATPLPTGVPAALPSQPAYGYLIDGADGDIYRAIVRLQAKECHLRVATKPFTIAGRKYEAGSVLLRGHENPSDLAALITATARDLHLDIRGTDTALVEHGPDLGGGRFRLLATPRIAIATQWPIASTSFGSTWFLLDYRMELRTSPINIQSLGRVDLRKYNVIVIPHTWNRGGLAGVLDEKVRGKLKTWVEAGGTLVAMGRSAVVLATKDFGFTQTRLKRDVLTELSIYAEALKREQDAQKIAIDDDAVWGGKIPIADEDETSSSTANGPPSQIPTTKPDVEALKRTDAWQRLFSPMGAFAATTPDDEHWLCFGLEERPPVLLFGDYAFMTKHPVVTPVRLAGAEHLRLSGLVWPEARERLGGTAYAAVERVGHGQIILFASDPFFRGYLEGSGRLLLNALILGPGMGTSPTMPW